MVTINIKNIETIYHKLLQRDCKKNYKSKFTWYVKWLLENLVTDVINANRQIFVGGTVIIGINQRFYTFKRLESDIYDQDLERFVAVWGIIPPIKTLFIQDGEELREH